MKLLRAGLALLAVCVFSVSAAIAQVEIGKQPPGAQGPPNATGCCIYETQPGVKTSRQKSSDTRANCKKLQTEHTMKMIAFHEGKKCEEVKE